MGKRTVASALAVYGFELTDTESCGRAYAHPWEPGGIVCVTRPDGSVPRTLDDAVRVIRYGEDGDRDDLAAGVETFPSVVALLATLCERARTVHVTSFGGGDHERDGGAAMVHVDWNDRASIHYADGSPTDPEEYDVIAQHPAQRGAILAAIRACLATRAGQTVALP